MLNDVYYGQMIALVITMRRTTMSIIVDLYVKHLNKQVEKYWNIYHFDMEPGHQSYNNEGDAFKHTYMSAELALFLGQKIAKYIGDKHEDRPDNPPGEKKMDLHNNAIGRLIASGMKAQNFFWFLKWPIDDKIADKVMQNMNAGLLITKPVE